MEIEVKNRLLEGLSWLLRPVVRLAIRNGVMFRDVSDLCKRVFVDVAATEYGIHGRDTNISRIAMMTGINRKDVKKLKDALNSGVQADANASADKVSRIITGWMQDPSYLTVNGDPAPLRFESGDLSFSALVDAYGKDIAPVTVLKEFKRSRVVMIDEAGDIHLLKHFYIPNVEGSANDPMFLDPAKLRLAAEILNDHLETICHNLYRSDTDARAKFERRATNHLMHKQIVPDFIEFLDKEGQVFLERVDAWLTEHEYRGETTPQHLTRLGLGMYFIEGEEASSRKEIK